MTFTLLVAEWPWIVGYASSAFLIFLWLRRISSTDAQPIVPARNAHGFGEPTSLRSAGAQFLRLSCTLLLLLLVVAVWTARLIVGGWNLWDAPVILAIVACWPLQEWLIHVFLLHLKPFTIFGRCIDPIVSRNHRNHHRDPWNPQLGITPPHIVWLYLSGVPGLLLLFLPAPQALSAAATYFSLVLNYEWVHYLIHTSYVPKTWFYKRLWRNHRLHHFKNEHFWYGVTMLSGDRLLQTQPISNRTERSDTCLTLGVESDLTDWADPVD